MTAPQKRKLTELLGLVPGGFLHHGCCIGADEQADAIGNACGFKTVGWPAVDVAVKNRAVKLNLFSRQPATRALARNQSIVTHVEWLIACPKEFKEVLRSGTWTTLRYARSADRELRIILPDGTVRNSF